MVMHSREQQFITKCSQFAELKRMERDHAKERQKLMKDKDAGTYSIDLYFPNDIRLPSEWQSQGTVIEGESNKNKDGEPCP